MKKTTYLLLGSIVISALCSGCITNRESVAGGEGTSEIVIGHLALDTRSPEQIEASMTGGSVPERTTGNFLSTILAPVTSLFQIAKGRFEIDLVHLTFRHFMDSSVDE